MNNVELDNQIFLLQRSNLPPELSKMVCEADILFLHDKNAECAALLKKIRNEMAEKGIALAKPDSMLIKLL